MKPLYLLPFVLLAACEPEPTQPLKTLEPNARVTVERIGVIKDAIAYDERRGIYIIVDTKTGKEYIGVSGIGITETSAHAVSDGKTSHMVEDER